MPDLSHLPEYRDLPLFEGRDERHAWEVFGPNDNLGTVNLLTEERVREAAKLVKRGASFGLDLPLDLPLREPVPEGGQGRGPYVHKPTRHRGGGDDSLDNFYLQGSSQWDSLRHIRFREYGYYQGIQDEDLDATERIGINYWSEHGISGRGVLIDLPRFMGDAFKLDRIEMTGPLIEEIAKKQGVELKPADILILRTGWMQHYLSLSDAERAKPEAMDARAPSPGLDGKQETAEWVWNHHFAAVAADNIAMEVTPVIDPSFQHRRILAMFGMPIGEIWYLEDLAADCARDGVYEFFLVSKPLNLRRGVGSPPNAIAFK